MIDVRATGERNTTYVRVVSLETISSREEYRLNLLHLDTRSPVIDRHTHTQ